MTLRGTVVVAAIAVLPTLCIWSSTLLHGSHAWVTTTPRSPRVSLRALAQQQPKKNQHCSFELGASSSHRRAGTTTTSPLQDFDAALEERLARADQAGTLEEEDAFWSPVYDNNNNKTVLREQEQNNKKDSIGSILLPRLTFTELLSLAFRDATSVHDFERRHQLAHSIHTAGGFAWIHLDDPGDAQIVQGVWDCIDQLFLVVSPKKDDDGDDDAQPQEQRSSFPMRHQTLTRENTPEAHQHSGYEFVQTSSNDDSLARLRPTVGWTAAQQAQQSYTQCLVMARAMAVVLYAGHVNVTPAVATAFLNQLLDEPDRPNAGAYQRLCLYKNTTTTTTLGETEFRESLRSHCDWTLTTPIPRSNVPGLELYSPALDAWICPEAPSSWEPNNDNNNKSIMVLTGKWMELVTAGSVQACIHRVVVRQNSSTNIKCYIRLYDKISILPCKDDVLQHGIDC